MKRDQNWLTHYCLFKAYSRDEAATNAKLHEHCALYRRRIVTNVMVTSYTNRSDQDIQAVL